MGDEPFGARQQVTIPARERDNRLQALRKTTGYEPCERERDNRLRVLRERETTGYDACEGERGSNINTIMATVSTQGPSWGYLKVNSSETLSVFGDKCPQNGPQNALMAPRTTLECPHEGPSVSAPPLRQPISTERIQNEKGVKHGGHLDIDKPVKDTFWPWLSSKSS